MDLGFFTMPIHPLEKDWRQCLQEDREAFIFADELGFTEGFVGEHATDRAENITSCSIFIASLANATKSIRLGTGTINMPNAHPVTVASQIAMLDHLLDGRLIFGISPGGLLSDAEAFGNLDRNRTDMFIECIDLVLKIWASDPPYNLKGKFWTVSTERTQLPDIGQGEVLKPLQEPHPLIVITVVAPYSKGVVSAAARGWQPISANFLLPQWVSTHWPKYVQGCEEGGLTPRSEHWRVAKSVFVADDINVAKNYALGPQSPYRNYYKQIVTKMKASGRANLFKVDQKLADDKVTLDGVLKDLVIWGTPEKVTDDLLAFRDQVGDFGTLLYAGKDWAEPKLARQSMEMMATQVMPAVNKAIS